MPGLAPKSNADLATAIAACLKASDFDCSKGQHGAIGTWDISAATDMTNLFVDDNSKAVPGADKFNADLSKWVVSRATTMVYMFYYASSFNTDISKWDVSKVTTMKFMFQNAKSFKRTLCGKWKTSTASDKDGMFDGSPGKICASTSKATSIET